MWRFLTGFFTLNHWSFLCFICRGFSAHKEGNYESKVAAFWGKVNECTGVFQASHNLNEYVQGQNDCFFSFLWLLETVPSRVTLLTPSCHCHLFINCFFNRSTLMIPNFGACWKKKRKVKVQDFKSNTLADCWLNMNS